jgi:hypothetical protein
MANLFVELWGSAADFTVEGAAIRSIAGDAEAGAGTGAEAGVGAGAGASGGPSRAVVATSALEHSVDPGDEANVGAPYALTSTGERIELESPVVFGRSPSGPQRCVVFSSPLVSGNHLRIEHEGDVLVAVDLNSTNGTILRREQ